MWNNDLYATSRILCHPYPDKINSPLGVVEKRKILNLVKEMEERLIVLSTFGKGSSIAHLERGCILVEMMRLAQCLVGKCAFRKFEIKIREEDGKKCAGL
jgi:hypothetical protein